jgi:hypothetical protein
MDVLVLGTSNCLISESFIKHFQKFSGLQIDNRSIGASSSSVGLYILETMEQKNFQFAILDYEINDSGVVGHNIKSIDDIRENIRSIVAITRSYGATPIITIIPSHETLRAATPAERAHLEVCKQEGVHYLNVAEFFREALSRKLVTLDFLMRDSAHMSTLVTPLIGEALAKGLGAINAAISQQTTHHTAVRKLRAVKAQSLFPEGSIIERKSSVYQSTYGKLRQGMRITVPVDENESLLALMMNTGGLGANVGFSSGESSAVKSLVVYWDKKNPDWFTAICVDFKHPLPGSRSGIDVEILQPDAEPTERTLHQKPFLDGRYGEVEIEGFLIGTQAKVEVDCTVIARPTILLDLWNIVGREDFLGRLAALAPAVS